MKILFLILIFFIYEIYQLSFIKVKKIKIKLGFRAVQISDYHNSPFINLKLLNKKLKKINPQIIFLTGDIISRDTKNFQRAEKFIKALKIREDIKILFVKGNHEYDNRKYGEFLKILKKHKIILLDKNPLEYKNVKIYGEDFENFQNLKLEKGKNILLTHAPEKALDGRNFNLILAGHTHGGQVRFPILGQVIGNNFKLFPKYSMGLYKINKSLLYVDGGLGGKINFRILDPAGITVIE